MSFNYFKYGSYAGSATALRSKKGRFDINMSQVIGDALFTFTTFTFTTPNPQDPFAPSSAAVEAQTAYTTASFVGGSYFSVVGGVQYWTVPKDGTYRIEAAGAMGNHRLGASYCGKGAKMRGDVPLNKGDVLAIIPGQQNPSHLSGTRNWHGGAGGSFVAKIASPSSLTPVNSYPLIVAGGGTGSRNGSATGVLAATGSTSTNGKNGDGSIGGANGLASPAGGGWSSSRSGGAGGYMTGGIYHADTRQNYIPSGYPGSGISDSRPGAGGFEAGGDATNTSGYQAGVRSQGGLMNTLYETSFRGSGGFGGGGAAAFGGMGGGGGYAGGGQGGNNSSEFGGGGGSFIVSTATNLATSDGTWTNTSTHTSGPGPTHTAAASATGLTNLGTNSAGAGFVIITLL